MKKSSFKLTFKKETPGTVVYEDVSKKLPITQVYVQKTALGDAAPQTIQITIEAA